MSHNNFGLRLSDNLKAGPISESEDETSGEAIGQGFTVYCNTSDYFQEILISGISIFMQVSLGTRPQTQLQESQMRLFYI